jgi:NADPH-dependent glutamate synthase beta subunit-like oxidoreductase
MDDELEHFTSCMLCLVKDGSGKLFPSCSVAAAPGMNIITGDDEIREARQTALELLLSEHVGDCEAPCRLTCPAHMNIPLMNRLIAAGKWEEALRVVKRDIALPSVLGRICPAPCEGACHRKTIDEAVSVCLLKRFVGDLHDLHPFPVPPLNGKRVAVAGAGPAGLSASYYLRMKGIEPFLFDREDLPGGELRKSVSPDILPPDVLDREISSILETGIHFTGNTLIDDQVYDHLKQSFDALVLATGTLDDVTKSFQLKGTSKGLEVNRNSYETSETGVFAIGNVLRSSKLAIRSAGQGKEVAFSVDQYLKRESVTGETERFNSRFGKLMQTEFSEYLKEASKTDRFHSEKPHMGLNSEEAVAEAGRCMHCDCRAADNCKLRNFSDLYQASQKRFQTSPRSRIQKYFQNTEVVYEPGKCIKCGICVRLTEKYGEKYGLTYIGRGFDIVINVPFNETLDAALKETSDLVARRCPTGALSLHDRKLS